MNYLVTASSLVLFALFYETSGAEDFDPTANQNQAAMVEPATTSSVFTDNYVPFDQPIIMRSHQTVRSGQVRTEQVTDIVQASFTSQSTEIAAPREDIRAISGDSVNLRAGPSTTFDIVGSATRGTEIALLQVNAENWAQVRLLETGETVWVAAWLLSD